MIPTRQLLEAWCAALVVPEGPDPHDVVTQFVWVPDPMTMDVFGVCHATVEARNEFDEVVPSYSESVFFEAGPEGPTFSPFGWADGVMNVDINCEVDGDFTVACTQNVTFYPTGYGALHVEA